MSLLTRDTVTLVRAATVVDDFGDTVGDDSAPPVRTTFLGYLNDTTSGQENRQDGRHANIEQPQALVPARLRIEIADRLEAQHPDEDAPKLYEVTGKGRGRMSGGVAYDLVTLRLAEG